MKHLILSPALFVSMMSSVITDINIDKKPVCPVCKTSDNVIPIAYGKPGRELLEKAQRGEVKLGGCTPVDKNNPHYHCKKDQKDF